MKYCSNINSDTLADPIQLRSYDIVKCFLTMFLSKSVEADDLPEMLDLRSALPPDRNHHNHHAPYFPSHHNLANGRAAPQSILKNSHNATNEWSDAHSNVPLRPTNGGAYLARSMTMAPVDSYPVNNII